MHDVSSWQNHHNNKVTTKIIDICYHVDVESCGRQPRGVARNATCPRQRWKQTKIL